MPPWLAVATLLIGLGSNAAPQREATRPLPPHDYWLVVPAGPDQAASAQERLRRGMMAALAESGLLPAGFPQPGTMVRSPSPTEAGVVDVSCSPPEQDASGPGCIRLGPLSYVELGTIDYANARAYLFEVFLFDSPPLRPLKREAGYTLTRVVVHHPIFQADLPPVPGRHLGEVFDALQRGLLVAGARPIQVQ